jgi:hypothetical protein
MIHARAGKPNMIVITLDGVEIHRCAVAPFMIDGTNSAAGREAHDL